MVYKPEFRDQRGRFPIKANANITVSGVVTSLENDYHTKIFKGIVEQAK